MKKIHCFIASLAGGGAEHQISILANLLVQRDYDVTIVTYNDIPDFYTLNGDVKRVRLNVKGNRIRKQLQIISFFLRIKTDCIISFREQMNFISLIPMLFRPKIKYIAGERNYTIGEPTFYLKVNMGFLYRRADYIVPNNYSQEAFLKKNAPHLESKIRTVINYTDLDDFPMLPMPLTCDVVKIGVFARFYKQKNYERFAYAIERLRSITDHRFQVVWYGRFFDSDGSENPGYIEMKTIINNLGINDVLVLKDAVKDVKKEAGVFHCLCLPSIYEGFSNSISEGICLGRPMMVSDVSDNSLMVHNGENGFLFDPNNIDSICNAFLSFFKLSYEEIENMAKRSRSIAESLFDKDQFINSYIKMIEE